MKVSVLIPVYNKAPFVKEAVESILNGTFQDFEIVCVDDKSTDGSLEILRSIADPRMRIIELPANMGPAGAANAGLDACVGEYIVRLDADDIAVPDRLAVQVEFMDAHPDIGASGGRLELFGDADASWAFPLDPESCAVEQLFAVPLSQGASILRRSVIEAHHLRYDPAWPRFGEDWLFWIRMGRVTRFANLDLPITHYRRGEHNSGHGRDRFADLTFLQKAVFEFFGIPFTEEEVDLHLMGSCVFKITPTKKRIRDLHAWHQQLLAFNKKHDLFPQAALAARLQRSWNDLFYYLPRYGAAPTLEHMRITGAWPLDKLSYLAKYRINAALGRVAAG